MRSTWNFFTAGQVHFGRGAIAHVGDLVKRLGSQRVLIVTDQTLASAGVVDRMRGPLAAAGLHVDVFDGGQPEPALEIAKNALQFARE